MLYCQFNFSQTPWQFALFALTEVLGQTVFELSYWLLPQIPVPLIEQFYKFFVDFPPATIHENITFDQFTKVNSEFRRLENQTQKLAIYSSEVALNAVALFLFLIRRIRHLAVADKT